MKFLASAILAVALSTSASHADIVSTVGLTLIPPPTGTTVQADWIPANGLPPQLIFAEQQGVTLAASLDVDTGAAIAAGTVISSYFVGFGTHDFNLYPFGNATADTSVTFDQVVLGIIYQSSILFQAANFAASDFLGAAGVTYQESSCPTLGFGCAFETSIISGYTDSASFAGNVVSFHNEYFYPGDVARVITAAAVPGPVVGAGLPGAAAFSLTMWSLWRRRRRKLT